MHRLAPPVADTLSFPVDRVHLQPKFESYKLSLSNSSSPSTCFPLPTPFETKPLADGARLSFAEVQDRAKHNHLAVGLGGELIWIERNGAVKAARIDPETAVPTFHDVIQLPPSELPSTSNIAPPYPVASALTAATWLVSDGLDSLLLLKVDPSSLNAQIEATFTLSPSSTFAGRPLQLHRADLTVTHPNEALALLSTARKGEGNADSQDPENTDQPKLGATSSRLKTPSSTKFEYFAVRIPLTVATGGGAGGGGGGGERREVSPEWTAIGSDLPAFVHFDPHGDKYSIASSGTLVTNDASLPTRSEKHDKAEEGTDDPLPNYTHKAAPASNPTPLPKPPPFSWSQDSASLTVAFPLPSNTPTSSIRITFSRQYLTLHIASPSTAASAPIATNFALPRVSHKRWWGEIDPHTSVWTFDREAEGRDSNFGILTLHLEKQHTGTKWSDVFATSSRPESRGGGEDPKIEELNEEWDYEEVAETVDPSELARISEEMEKWTRGIMEGGPSTSNDGLGHGVPTSLMGDEMDVEIDAETGRSIVVNWVEPSQNLGRPTIVTPHASLPYSLLSETLPFSRLPTSSSPSAHFDSSITIKHDVDGLLFTPPSANMTGPRSYQWTHRATFPALAFVLATKRDTKFIYHHLDHFALAFDSPVVLSSSSSSSSTPAPANFRDGGGNLFVYFAPKDKETKGKQMVLRVGSVGSGAVVGVAGVELEGGSFAIVALCERELVVLKLE